MILYNYLGICLFCIILISGDCFHGRLSTLTHKLSIFSREPNLDGRPARTLDQFWSTHRKKYRRRATYLTASQTSTKQPKCSGCCHDETCIFLMRFWRHNEITRVCLTAIRCFYRDNNSDCQFSSIWTSWPLLAVAAVKLSSRSWTCTEAASLKLRSTEKLLFDECSP